MGTHGGMGGDGLSAHTSPAPVQEATNSYVTVGGGRAAQQQSKQDQPVTYDIANLEPFLALETLLALVAQDEPAIPKVPILPRLVGDAGHRGGVGSPVLRIGGRLSRARIGEIGRCRGGRDGGLRCRGRLCRGARRAVRIDHRRERGLRVGARVAAR